MEKFGGGTGLGLREFIDGVLSWAGRGFQVLLQVGAKWFLAFQKSPRCRAWCQRPFLFRDDTYCIVTFLYRNVKYFVPI